MKILFLDDMKERHDYFQESCIDQDITHVWTSKEAIDKLKTDKFDAIFLDHDLGGEVYQKSIRGTGCEVAEFIARNDVGTPDIVLHSWNPEGVKNMKNILGTKDYQVVIDPFPCKHIRMRGFRCLYLK